MPRGNSRGGGGGGGGGGGSGGYRGHKSGHKGQRRQFTNAFELDAQKEKEEREKQWRRERGEVDSDDSDKEGSEKKEDESESSSEEDEQQPGKAKGVEGLIEVENPNRVVQKLKKVSELDNLDTSVKPELSRREKEELDKQQAKAHYQKLQAAGKTDDARADLARLALIRKQREEAAKKRDEEKKMREAVKMAKTDSLNKALGKKKT